MKQSRLFVSQKTRRSIRKAMHNAGIQVHRLGTDILEIQTVAAEKLGLPSLEMSDETIVDALLVSLDFTPLVEIVNSRQVARVRILPPANAPLLGHAEHEAYYHLALQSLAHQRQFPDSPVDIQLLEPLNVVRIHAEGGQEYEKVILMSEAATGTPVNRDDIVFSV